MFRREADRVYREFDRLFDRFFGGGEMISREVGWMPDLDLSESDKEYLVTVELPGVDDKDVKVEASLSTVAIRGEKKPDEEMKGLRSLYRGRAYGPFERVLTLPSSIDPSRVRARFRKGLLEVTLPRAEVSPTKTVTIEAGEK